ncbi:MAG: hypothetical protein ISR77_07515 [Pirellulaceae bacterium]|nr:hypothetical protein [Pirellulaceae bacterium]
MTCRSTDGQSAATATVPTVCAACAGMLAAWVAAGSTGALAHPLRVALTWVALLVAVVSVWPWRRRQRLLALAATALVGLPFVVPVTPIHEVLVVAAVLGLLATGQQGASRTVLLVCSLAVLALAVFRLACLSVPVVWLFSDNIGAVIGSIGSAIAGKPLNVGATFAGLDFLVVIAAFYAGWLYFASGPRIARSVYAAVAILAVHLLYLVVLAFALDLAEMLPDRPEPAFDHPYVPPDWSWSAAVRVLLPWNVPAVAAVVHVCVAAVMLRWVSWRSVSGEQPSWSKGDASPVVPENWRRLAISYGPLALAVLLPAAATLSLGRSDLTGKTIVAGGQGNLDWGRPQHDLYGQQSAGTFGMLPLFVESLGGEFRTSPDLPAGDLAAADVLLLLRPTGPMPQAQRQRIWDFVRQGGSLLVAAEPFVRVGDVMSASDEVLKPTSMSVRQDVAISVTGNWQHAYNLLAHPVASGVDDRVRYFFTDSAASIRVGWPARPIVTGRWGWSDPGTDAVLTGVYRYEAGEKLGDLVLAAEQRFGQGTVAVVGDSRCLTNEGNVRGYALTGRLLSYLAGKSGGPQSPWRWLITLVVCAAFVVVVVWRPNASRVVWIALLISTSLAASHSISRHSTRVMPDGRILEANEDHQYRGLAYIDASHVEAHSDADWGFDGINGLALTLMRNGYLTLTMPKLTSECLDRTALVVSIAPARRFSPSERNLLGEFVERGGAFICTVGAEEASASQPLLADFGIRVPVSPVPTLGKWREPVPMGQVRMLPVDANGYGAGDYEASVLFYTGWPVEVDRTDSKVLVYGLGDEPVAVARDVVSGKVVVIGDTGFALNKNLEYTGGEPFEGWYENAHFWRWLIARVAGQPDWVPPEPPDPNAMEANAGQEVEP